jgi:carbon storage regulator
VTLEALTQLMSPREADLARARSAELRGLLAEIAREHGITRALMRQELAFLDHLTRMIGRRAADRLPAPRGHRVQPGRPSSRPPPRARPPGVAMSVSTFVGQASRPARPAARPRRHVAQHRQRQHRGLRVRRRHRRRAARDRAGGDHRVNVAGADPLGGTAGATGNMLGVLRDVAEHLRAGDTAALGNADLKALQREIDNLLANLRAPIIVSGRRGFQVINEADNAPMRAPLFAQPVGCAPPASHGIQGGTAMLMMTRRAGQKIVLGDDITIEVVEVAGNTVRIGVSAPRSVPVYREEIGTAVRAENQAAATGRDLPDLPVRAQR